MKKITKWKGPLDLGQFNETVKSFEKESDRGVAIVAGAFVEQYLKDFLSHFLVQDQQVAVLFEGPFGPLASFAARAKMCYAMRLINETFLQDLDIIRNIRNHFAHHPAETSFENKEVAQLCAELSLSKFSWGPDKTILEQHGTRQTFIFTVGSCLGRMHNGRIAHTNGKFQTLDVLRKVTWGEKPE